MTLTNCGGVMCIVVLLSIGFALVTLPIYILLLMYLFLKRQRFSSSFYKIFLSAGIADISITVHKLSTTEIPQILFYDSVLFNASMATISSIGIWYLYFAQIVGTILLALNRFTAVAFPVNYEKFWSNKILLLAFAIQWISPVIAVVPMLHSCCQSVFANVSLEAVFVDEKVNDIYYIADLVIECLLFLPILIIVHFFLFLKLAKRPKLSQHQAQHLRTEIKLAIIGIFTSTCLVAMNSITILATFKIITRDDSGVLSFLWYLISDLFTLASPYLLLACSQEVRRNFLKFLSCRSISTPRTGRSYQSITIQNDE